MRGGKLKLCVGSRRQGRQCVPESSVSSFIEHVPGEVKLVAAKLVFKFKVRYLALV